MHRRLLSRTVVACLFVFIAASAPAADKKIKDGKALVFGSVLFTGSIGGSGYTLTLRRVEDGKRVKVPIDVFDRTRAHFRFAKNVEPGRYFLESAQAPYVEWTNAVAGADKYFEAGAGTAVYIGQWRLDMDARSTRYTVAYPNYEVLDFVGQHAQVDPAALRKGVLGGPNEPVGSAPN
ncbi:MAG: hypothetical protein BGP24_00670 [Lysobacterales bacterium 69-70]|nr:hypothetical protein [Xanthomonadaceae bacterium]ODU36179.1 MAG: hypothetical protein ABS97_02300 [Xanthomonadaceae bacterium SCN 69-320]ODV17555.1 MAG: hypothetical protein ABT27_16660 [Xanthomonadaceae bacterium SCN 69-25]OJY99363.1 MAG: hypothetical protein BGP24_00670 [Xanthomonadales bacterium 69-70]